MIRFAKLLLVSALMITIGAQWAVLQSVAWVGMAVTYSIDTGSVSEGLSETFDGAHPCAMCLALNKAKHTEKKDPKQEASKKKLELFAQASASIIIAAPVTHAVCCAGDESATALVEAPPHQPPRV